MRHLRNTSDQTELKTILNDFKTHLKKIEYEDSEIQPILQEIIAINLTDLLNKFKHKNEEKADVPNVLITKFNPCMKGLKKRL